MERTAYIFITGLLFLTACLFGQSNMKIYRAYLNGNMQQWKQLMDSIEFAGLKTVEDTLELINYQYGYVAWCIDTGNNADAEKYMKKAQLLINTQMQNHSELSTLYAYKAAFIGYSIGLAPYKAPFIGPESTKYAERAINADSANAFAHIQLGNIAYYTPEIFGGSRHTAIEHYLQAYQLMNTQEDTKHNWNYLNLLATIVSAYIETKQLKEAERFSIKALSIEPAFKWVSEDLYPKVLNGLQNE